MSSTLKIIEHLTSTYNLYVQSTLSCIFASCTTLKIEGNGGYGFRIFVPFVWCVNTKGTYRWGAPSVRRLA